MSTIPSDGISPNTHSLFLSTEFIEHDDLKNIVKGLMSQIDENPIKLITLDQVPLVGSLDGRKVINERNWLMNIFHQIVLIVEKIWHNFSLWASTSYSLNFNRAAELISKKSIQNERDTAQVQAAKIERQNELSNLNNRLKFTKAKKKLESVISHAAHKAKAEESEIKAAREADVHSARNSEAFSAAKTQLQNFDLNTPKKVAQQIDLQNKAKELGERIEEKKIFIIQSRKAISTIQLELNRILELKENHDANNAQIQELIDDYEKALAECDKLRYFTGGVVAGKQARIIRAKFTLSTEQKEQLKADELRLDDSIKAIKELLGESAFIDQSLNQQMIDEIISTNNLSSEAMHKEAKDLEASRDQLEEGVKVTQKEIEEMEVEVSAFQASLDLLKRGSTPPEEVPANNSSPMLPLDEDFLLLPDSVGGLPSVAPASMVETQLVQKTPQVQMLADIAEKTHPEIAQMWQIILNKFPDAEVVKEWSVSADGSFKMVLTQPIVMWVSDKDYNVNGGVIMSLGSRSDGVIKGTLVKGDLPKDHKNQVQKAMKKKDFSSKKTEISGMIFDKSAGVETLCKHGVFWPEAQFEHFLRAGETEEGKMNIVVTGTAMGKSLANPKSIAVFEEAWGAHGEVLSNVNTKNEKQAKKDYLARKKLELNSKKKK